jgi:hypothetical protein
LSFQPASASSARALRRVSRGCHGHRSAAG